MANNLVTMERERMINTETEYFIVSLRHTMKWHKYITLWRPDNKGYSWPLELSGRYQGYEPGYHNDGIGENIPVPCADIPPSFIIKDDEGRDCIAHKRNVVQFIKKYVKVTYTQTLH